MLVLQATPAPIITHITQRPDQVELEAIVIEGNNEATNI
jgi:hypothetical protein